MPRVLAKAFTAVEHELRLEGRKLDEQRGDIVADADHQDIMAVGQQRAGDVVLGFFGLLLDFAFEGGIVPLGVWRIEDHRDLHATTSTRTRHVEIESTHPLHIPPDGREPDEYDGAAQHSDSGQ